MAWLLYCFFPSFVSLTSFQVSLLKQASENLWSSPSMGQKIFGPPQIGAHKILALVPNLPALPSPAILNDRSFKYLDFLHIVASHIAIDHQPFQSLNFTKMHLRKKSEQFLKRRGSDPKTMFPFASDRQKTFNSLLAYMKI